MSRVDNQIFNNWHTRYIDRSEWTQATGLKRSAMSQALTFQMLDSSGYLGGRSGNRRSMLSEGAWNSDSLLVSMKIFQHFNNWPWYCCTGADWPVNKSDERITKNFELTLKRRGVCMRVFMHVCICVYERTRPSFYRKAAFELNL